MSQTATAAAEAEKDANAFGGGWDDPEFGELPDGGGDATLGGGDAAPGKRHPESGDATPEGGDATPEGGDATPEGGDATPEGGDATPEGGDATPEGGDATPEGGDATPEGGDATPEGGDATPEGGDATPEGGARQPAGYSPSYDDLIAAAKEAGRTSGEEVARRFAPDPPPGAGAAADPADDASPTIAPPTKRLDTGEFQGEKLNAKLADIRTADPAIADGIKAIIEPLAGALGDAYGELDTVRVRHNKDAAQNAETAADAAIEAKHPGWKETVKTPEFHTWYEGQPAFVQQAVKAGSTQDGIDILDMYHASSNGAATPTGGAGEKTEEQRAARRAASRQPASSKQRGTLPPSGTATPPDEFSDGWFDADFEAEEKAARSSRS